MEKVYEIGNQTISETEVKEQVESILKILKEKKQTYSINKFVLEETINSLFEMTF